jgi:hypothetical protein
MIVAIIVISFIRPVVPYQEGPVGVFGRFLLAGFIVVAICSIFAEKLPAISSVLISAIVSVACLVGDGMLWASHAGFEGSTGFVTVSLYLCLPSGIAGGILGWMNRQRFESHV